MSKSSEKFGWGVWLGRTSEWSPLPPRLCKPTPFNSDLNAGLIEVVRLADRNGDRPELKRIPARDLKLMRANHR